MFRTQRGFSLIELLVVIAIIGILSSISLAALNVARAKGADAAVKADLDTVRKQAAIYLDSNSNYGADAADCASGMFSGDANISGAIAHASTVSNGTASCFSDDGSSSSGTQASSWAVSVPLKTDPSLQWCADSAEFNGIGVADNTTTADVATCH